MEHSPYWIPIYGIICYLVGIWLGRLIERKKNRG